MYIMYVVSHAYVIQVLEVAVRNYVLYFILKFSISSWLDF